VIDLLSGALVGIERIVGALQELGGRFAWLVIGESAREMAADSLSLVLQFESLDARKNVTHFLSTAFRQQGHEFVATQADGEI
jgi:hypothetical protein